MTRPRWILPMILVVVVGVVLALISQPLPDVHAGAWYAGLVGIAHWLRLMVGYPDGKFRPDAFATRAEVAVIVIRTMAEVLLLVFVLAWIAWAIWRDCLDARVPREPAAGRGGDDGGNDARHCRRRRCVDEACSCPGPGVIYLTAGGAEQIRMAQRRALANEGFPPRRCRR